MGWVDWLLELAPSSGRGPAIPNVLSRCATAEFCEVMHPQVYRGFS